MRPAVRRSAVSALVLSTTLIALTACSGAAGSRSLGVCDGSSLTAAAPGMVAGLASASFELGPVKGAKPYPMAEVLGARSDATCAASGIESVPLSPGHSELPIDVVEFSGSLSSVRDSIAGVLAQTPWTRNDYAKATTWGTAPVADAEIQAVAMANGVAVLIPRNLTKP